MHDLWSPIAPDGRDIRPAEPAGYTLFPEDDRGRRAVLLGFLRRQFERAGKTSLAEWLALVEGIS